MAKYFGRQYEINLGNGEQIFDSRKHHHPLQIEFTIETSFGGAISKMELSIYNLSNESATQFKQKQPITFQAGYPDNFGPLFYGKVINFRTTQQGTERKTTLHCWSGLDKLQSKPCLASFGVGSNYFDIVDFIATDAMDKKPIYIGFDEGYKASMGNTLGGGYSADDPHRTLLNSLAIDHEFEWLVENERCVLMRRGASNPGKPILINPENGLVGGVSLNRKGIDFEMKLNSDIKIGDRIKVESKSSSINFSEIYNVSLPEKKTRIGAGNYVIKALRRKGNYYGQNSWATEFVAWREGETGLEKQAA